MQLEEGYRGAYAWLSESVRTEGMWYRTDYRFAASLQTSGLTTELNRPAVFAARLASQRRPCRKHELCAQRWHGIARKELRQPDRYLMGPNFSEHGSSAEIAQGLKEDSAMHPELRLLIEFQLSWAIVDSVSNVAIHGLFQKCSRRRYGMLAILDGQGVQDD